MSATRSLATPGGSYQRWLAGAALLVVPFMVIVLTMTAQFRFERQPVIEQAVTARRLAAGQGYTTAVIEPRSLVFAKDLQHHPELRHGPVAVLPAALLVKVMGESGGKTLALASMLAWLLAVWLAYGLARAFFGPPAATLTALLLTFSPAALAFGISGDGQAWAMPLLVLLWFFVAVPPRGGARAVAVGVTAALAILASYSLALPLALALLPALAVDLPGTDGAEASTKDRRTPWLACLACLVAVSPWLVRNQRVAGTPLPGLNSYDVMSYTEDSPGRSIERRYVDPGATVPSFVLGHKKQLLQKALTGAHNLASTAGQAIDLPLLGLFLAALLMSLSGRRRNARNALAAAWLWHAALLSAGGQDFRLLAIWLPLLTVYAAGFLADRLNAWVDSPERRWRVTWQPAALRRWAVAGLMALLVLPGLGPQVFAKGRLAEPRSAPNLKLLKHQVAAEQVVLTDDPWLVAWQTDRVAVWLPQNQEDRDAVLELGDVKLIYFTAAASPLGGAYAEAERGAWWSWAQVMPTGILDYLPIESRVEGERVLLKAPAPGR